MKVGHLQCPQFSFKLCQSVVLKSIFSQMKQINYSTYLVSESYINFTDMDTWSSALPFLCPFRFSHHGNWAGSFGKFDHAHCAEEETEAQSGYRTCIVVPVGDSRLPGELQLNKSTTFFFLTSRETNPGPVSPSNCKHEGHHLDEVAEPLPLPSLQSPQRALYRLPPAISL